MCLPDQFYVSADFWAIENDVWDESIIEAAWSSKFQQLEEAFTIYGDNPKSLCALAFFSDAYNTCMYVYKTKDV